MTTSTEKRRVFFALEPGDDARNALAGAIEPLRQAAEPRLRWVDPAGWHITLRFIGDVPASQLADLSACMTDAAPGHSPLTLHLTRIETFPSAQRPLVLAATGAATPAAAALVEDLEGACTRVGLPPEQRAWRCHLTLARVRGRKPLQLEPRKIDIPVPAQQLLLMESVVDGGRRQYRPIARAPLTRNSRKPG